MGHPLTTAQRQAIANGTRPPYRAALTFTHNGGGWAVLENFWGGALIARCADETTAHALAATFNAQGA